MDRFNEYINDHVAEVKGLEEDWVYLVLTVSLAHACSHHSFLSECCSVATGGLQWKSNAKSFWNEATAPPLLHFCRRQTQCL